MLRGWLHGAISARAEFQPGYPGWKFSPALTINPNKIQRAITWQEFQPGLSFSPAACNHKSFQPGLKNNRLNGFILRVCLIFEYFTYNHSLTQVKWWTNQRLNASKKRNTLIVLFRDTQIISARADISARVDDKYSCD
jgi:hypothetical protein